MPSLIRKLTNVLTFLLVVEEELRKSQIGPSHSPKQPVKSTKSNARVENGPPELPPSRRDDKPPPLPPVHTIPSRKNPPGNLSVSAPAQSPKEKRSKNLTSECTPPKVRPYKSDRSRDKPDLPSRPKPPILPDKKPQLPPPPGRPALPDRPAKQGSSGTTRVRSVSNAEPDVQPRLPQETRKSNTMKPLSSNKTPLIPNQSVTSPIKGSPLGRPTPPGRPRNMAKHGSVDKSSSIGSTTSSEPGDNNGINTGDPTQVIEEINRICSNLSDIASEGVTVFNRSLESFAELSEQMQSMLQSRDNSVSTRVKVSQLRDKIGLYRGLLTQINSNPTHDYTTQLESAVSDISKRCSDLYAKLF